MAQIFRDANRCQSIGVCESMASDYFEMNSDGDLEVLHDGDVPSADLDRVRAAVESCPNLALKLIGDASPPTSGDAP